MKKLFSMVVTILMSFALTVPAMAGEKVEELSLNQAMQRAFTYDAQLRNTELDLEKLDISLDSIRWSMHGVLSGYNIQEETDKATHKTFFETDTNYRLTEKSLDNQKRQLKVDVKEAYYNVLMAEQDLAFTKDKLAVEMVKHSQTIAKFKVGMATQLDVLAAESKLKDVNVSIEEKNNAVTKAYTNLNKLLGSNQDERPRLTDIIEFQPVEKLDVDTMILKAVNNSYEVWAQEQKAKTAANTKYYEQFYDIGEYSESQAQNSLKDTKEKIRLQARSYCLDIIDKQNEYTQAEVKEKQLEESIRAKTVSYQVGLVTKDELDGLKLSLEEVKLLKNSCASGITITYDKLQRLTSELSTTI